MKRPRLVLFIWMAIGLACSGGRVSATDRVTFAVDWIFYGKHAPFMVAQDKGFFQKHGLAVDMSRGHGSSDTIKRVGAKTTDFGFADTANLVVARTRDTRVKGVAIIHAKSLYTVYTLKRNGIAKPQDLKGKTLGAPAKDVSRTLFPAFARLNGLDPDKDVKWIDMTAAARLSSLLTGKVDAFSGFGTATPTFVAGAKKAGREIVEIKYGDWGLDTYAHSMLAQDSLLAEKPDLAKRFLAAALEAWAWSMKNREEAIQIFHKRSPATKLDLARAHLDLALDVLVDDHVRKNGLGFYDEGKMKRTVDVIVRYMELPPVNPSDVYTNAFLPKIQP